MDPELTQLGILLELTDQRDGAQIDLAHAGLPSMGLVVKPVDALLHPAPQGRIDPGSVGVQIASDALDIPTLGVQPHDGQAPLGGVVDVQIRRIAPARRWQWRLLR